MNKAQYERLRSALDYCRIKSKELPAKRNPQFVYVIQCNEYVKIGIATNVQSRLVQIQTSNPSQVKVLKSWPVFDPGYVEDQLHILLAEYRVRGEWFKLPSNLLAKLLLISDISNITKF